MTDYENAVEIKGLTKKFDGFTLDNIDLTVAKGSIMGFIGQNGAGKSTTINCLLNIMTPTSGEIKLLGLDNRKDELEIKENIAAIFDELPFHEELNGDQFNFIFKDIFSKWNSETFFEYLDRFELPRKKKLGQFSKGMKMKFQIAAALSHSAKLLIMDEATTGLDPVVRNEMLDIFLEYLQDENNSILMSSHITSDLEKIADSVTFIDKGKLLLTGCKDDIIESHGLMRVKRSEFSEIAKEDFISARVNDFGADVLVSDKYSAMKKYSGATIDAATIDEIMLFYVNRAKKEWS